MAREGSLEKMEISRVYGTKPYLPAEFLVYHNLSTKIDTYSFGVVLFEIATGLPAYDKDRPNKFLTKHIWSIYKQKGEIDDELLDEKLKRTPDALLFIKNFIKIGLECTEERAENRPEMTDVLRNLDNYIKSTEQIEE